MIFKNLVKCEKGSIIVELGLLLPLLVAITYGFIMFTNVIRTDIILQVAAREGAREYAVTNDINKAKNSAILQLKMGGVDIDIINIESENIDKKRIIKVNKNISFYIPFAGQYDIRLKKGAVFYEENN